MNSRDSQDVTALMWAVMNKHNMIVKLLLDQPDIDVNFKGASKGLTALYIAASHANVEAMQLILATNSVDVNCEDSDGGTALHTAVANGNFEAIQLLLAHPRVDVNHSDHEGFTALLLCTVIEGHWKIMQLLLAHPMMCVNHSDNTGNTALICAAFNGHEKSVQLLLEDSRVDVNYNGCNALHAAVAKDHVGVVGKLLEHPNINLDESLEGLAR